MPSFGDELKRERELREISLREVSEATKINLRYLEALERNDFRHLPGGVFNKGFVRAYAQFIGVDPESMINAYLLEERNQGRDAGDDPNVFRPTHPEAKDAPAAASSDGRGKRVAVVAAALVIVAIAVFAAIRWWPRVDAPEARDARGQHEATVPPATEIAETAQPVDAADAHAEERPADAEPAETRADDGPAARTPDDSRPGASPTEPPRAANTAPSPRTSDDAGSTRPDTSAPAPPASVTDVATRSATTGVEPASVDPDVTVVEVDRATRGSINCDNRRIQTLRGVDPGTLLRFSCSSFLVVDADDGGALLVGAGGAARVPLGADGVPVEGLRVPLPRSSS